MVKRGHLAIWLVTLQHLKGVCSLLAGQDLALIHCAKIGINGPKILTIMPVS